MSNQAGPPSVLDQLAAAGKLRRSPGAREMPELVEDLGTLPSLADLLIAERDAERTGSTATERR